MSLLLLNLLSTVPLSYCTVFPYQFKTSAASILHPSSITYMLYYPFLAYFSYDLDDRFIESQLDSSCTYHSGWFHQVLHFPSSKPPLHVWTFLYPASPLYYFSLIVLYPLYLIPRFLDFFTYFAHWIFESGHIYEGEHVTFLLGYLHSAWLFPVASMYLQTSWFNFALWLGNNLLCICASFINLSSVCNM